MRVIAGISAKQLILFLFSSLAAFSLGESSFVQESESLKFIPPDSIGFAHVRVGDLLTTEWGQTLNKQIRREGEFGRVLNHLEQRFGLSISDVESVTAVVLNPDLPKWLGNYFEERHRFGVHFEPVFIVTTKNPYERRSLLRISSFQEKGFFPSYSGRGNYPDKVPADRDGRFGLKKEISGGPNHFHPHEEHSYSRDPLPPLAVQFLSQRSFLFGRPKGLMQYTDRIAKISSESPKPLAPVVSLADKKFHLFVGGRIPQPLKKLYQTNVRHDELFIPGLGTFYPLINQPVGLGILIGPEAKLEMVSFGSNPASAALTSEAAKAGITFLDFNLPEILGVNSRNKKSMAAKLLPDIHKALKSAKIQTDQNKTSASLSMKLDPEIVKGFMAAMAEEVEKAKTRVISKNNLRQFAIALHNYHDVYRRFPAAGMGNPRHRKPAKKLLSWRVHILPYVEQGPLYDQFKLDEPWDSPHNKKLISQMPKIFAAPVKSKAKPGMTYYQVFVGQGTPFDPRFPGGTRIANITDGTSNTFMIAEAGTPVIWTKPEDIPFDPKKAVPPLGWIFPDGFHVALCDGSVQFIHKGINQHVLKNLINAQDGNVIPGDLFGRGREFRNRPSVKGRGKATKKIDVKKDEGPSK